MNAGKVVKNSLKSLQRYKLFNWIDNNKDMARSKTADGLAVIATEQLGFNISATNIDNARRSLGIRFRNPESQSKSHDRTRQLAKCMVIIFDALELPIPDDLKRIISGKKFEQTMLNNL